MIAEFIRFYRSYTFEQVLGMPAFHFYLLYFQINKLKARESLNDVTVSSFPHADQNSRTQILQSYRINASDTVELIEDNDDFSNLTKLKRKLNK